MTLHVIGAGLAGLSAALAAADSGMEVILHESAGQAGGRCRSWLEPSLGAVIDNGTHMVVGGNKAVFSFLHRTGATNRLVPAQAAFPMVDFAKNRRWTATPLRLLPSLLTSFARMSRTEDASVEQCLGSSRHYRDFWDPIALAVMNTPSDQASAEVFRRVLTRTFWKGLDASRPYVVRHSLSDTFIIPGLDALARAGGQIRLGHPLRHLTMTNGRATELVFDDETLALGRNDLVILAVPWVNAAGLLPGLPDLPASPIVNAHFQLSDPPSKLPEGGFVGLLGATAQWLFVRGTVVSVTVSGAGNIVDRSVGELAECLWSDVAKALEINELPEGSRVIKEKRATLFHSCAVEAKRPQPQAGENLFLAGDWTATGLPCTLEGALVSGSIAACGIRRLLRF